MSTIPPARGSHESAPDDDAMFDQLAARAGAALRRPAPADGVRAIAARRRRQQAAKATVVGGLTVVILAGALVFASNRDDQQFPAAAPDTIPVSRVDSVPDTLPATTVESMPEAPVSMWPQSTIDEVREAQQSADAGDPAYTWQVDPQLLSQESDPLLTDTELWAYLASPGAAIVDRFLQERMGWEQFLFSGESTVPLGGELRGLVFLRCAPGETNPLYPTAWDGNQDAPGGHRCAPTIDELRYETVRLDLSQPDRQGADGIWVVSQWTTPAPFAQADPSVVEAEATAHLEGFLRSRIEGEGAEGYVETFYFSGGPEDVPLLYATTTGALYERFEIERLTGPGWPNGDMGFTVRLFAEGGETVVEQRITVDFDNGRPTFRHNASNTTENGLPLP